MFVYAIYVVLVLSVYICFHMVYMFLYTIYVYVNMLLYTIYVHVFLCVSVYDNVYYWILFVSRGLYLFRFGKFLY